jgi:hypothetical protein
MVNTEKILKGSYRNTESVSLYGKDAEILASFYLKLNVYLSRVIT